MSLLDLDPISLAIEAFGHARKVLWLADDEALAGGPALAADIAAVIAGMPAVAHFVATTATDGSFEAGAARLIEYRGSRRYGQCTGPCSEEVWPLAGAGEPPYSHFSHCPRCGLPARDNVLSGELPDWVTARLERQEIDLAAWQKHPGSALAVELGGLAGAPQLAALARRSAAMRLRCGAAYDAVGPDGVIALAWPPADFVAQLRARLSSAGLMAAAARF